MRAWVGLLATVLVVGLAADGRPQSLDLDTYVVFGEERVAVGGRTVFGTGDVGSNVRVTFGAGSTAAPPTNIAADAIRVVGNDTRIRGQVFFNTLEAPTATVIGAQHSPISVPLFSLAAPGVVTPGTADVTAAPGQSVDVPSGAYDLIKTSPDSTLVLQGGTYEVDKLIVRGRGAQVRCSGAGGCTVRVRTRLSLTGRVGETGTDLAFVFAGTGAVVVGRAGGYVQATVDAPFATVRLKSSAARPSLFVGRVAAREVVVSRGASVHRIAPQPFPVLYAIGPSVLNNATAFGVQLTGAGFSPGSQLIVSDAGTGTTLATLPTTWISDTEMTALVPAGVAVPTGMQRELRVQVLASDGQISFFPLIGHCQTDHPASPTACTSHEDCSPNGGGFCVTPDQRLTMFNDAVFLNPNSAAVLPAPAGACDDGTPCTSAATCTGIGSGACSPKVYVTPQQRDEVWVFNTGTGQFVDLDGGQSGIQGIPVGDNPFHVETLAVGGPPRAWVVNRFDDAVSILDPATDVELARVTGAALGVPGRLRMETEIEFNRAGTRAYLSNENLDEVQVLDISGANRDAPVWVGTIDVGVNPRGMVTNAADTRLYVANIQSADVSVVDIAPGSPTENQVVATVAARATDDIVGGRADGWEAFVIGGRAPRGIVFSDAQNALFVTSIGPQTGPRAGVGLIGGSIVNPTITVIDAMTDTIVAHVALDGQDPDRAACSDPELAALDDARDRLYVTCQGSGTVDVLDTAALAAGLPAEVGIVALPLPVDAVVPTLSLNPSVGGFGAKVCGAFTSNPGAPCTSDAQCTGCPATQDGVPVVCCAVNNPVGLHNGPRGIALAEDGDTLWVVNQFTTSIAALDVSPADPMLITVAATTSFPGAFGADTTQRDRRLGQIEFFTDVKKTGISCATCHIDDHQDGVFFEADVVGPRLRRVLSVRGTRDFPPLLQDQLVPDLTAFTDVVVHIERGGPVCTPCTEANGMFTCFPAPEGSCTLTSNSENQQNTLYAKGITFFPNPNLDADGALSTTVALPGGGTGDARHGADLFDQLACASCHPEPLFTIDQFRVFNPQGFSLQPVRMREVSTPVFLPLRASCQDGTRVAGIDGSSGFGVPTLRGIWDTFPLLVSGAAGLAVVGPEPVFSPGCTPGSSGCCTQLQSPLNPGGTAVPPQHLAVATKDAIRATLTPPLAVPGSGHGSALGLSPGDLDDLVAYLRSL